MAIHTPEGDQYSHIPIKRTNPSSLPNAKSYNGEFTEAQSQPTKTSQSSNLSPMELTYTSLVQQYLSLLCFENAAFLAERMVAQCPSKNSVYLLATCYYRMGQVKRAYSVLTGKSQSKSHILESDNDNYQKDNGSDVSARFLLAKCCIELGFLEEAEDCLLPRVCGKSGRLGWNYSRKKKLNEKKSIETADAMKEWILSEPCPIPNGAAGLYLLGLICRNSHRKQQAIKYFSLSLKLDPMMWTSFEALCEMGCHDSYANPNVNEIDPIAIFGVTPPTFQQQRPNEGSSKRDEFPYPHDNIKPPISRLANKTFQNEVTFMSPNLDETPQGRENLDLHLTPPSAAPMNLTFKTPHHPSIERSHSQHKSSRTSRKYSLPVASTLFGDKPDSDFSMAEAQNISAIPNIHSGGQKIATSYHQIRGSGPDYNPTVMFDTPNLTPIKYRDQIASMYDQESGNPGQESTRARLFNNDTLIAKHKTSRNSLSNANNSAIANIASMAQNKSTSVRSSATNPLVLTQARKVVARLYYGPSPDVVSPHNQNRWSSSFYHRSLNNDEHQKMEMTLNLSQSRISFSEECGAEGVSKQKLDLSDATAKTSGGVLGGIGSSTIKNKQDRSQSDDNEYKPKPSKEIQYEIIKNMEVRGGQEFEADDNCIQQILSLLCTLGTSYKLLCQYECQSALKVFHTLTPSQYNTGWVQHQIGKAYFEMADYHSAKHSLELMQSLEPHRMKGLELLSTAFWHLKKEVELCNLAQRVVDFDRLCPESWCVIGNCFSLQKEHETALQFFRRSIQIDPTFTYSYTLSGHEYVSNEDFDRATKCYRDAIRSDERHYNAWYGLGAIYFRQEKYDLAEYHFQRALSINPQSSILHCHLGMAQYANGKPHEALETLHGAFHLDPRNAQARYQRATIYMSLDQPLEALEELERVRDAAPREASVHFAMGKVCKRLGWPERAMRCYLTALDLDPKDNNLIKAAMDRLNDVDLEEDVSAF